MPTLRFAPSGALLLLAVAAQAQDAAVPLPPIQVEGQGERATDRVRGYVARQATAGTKTDTPIIQVPQSISVITRDQIDARQAQTLGQAMRYSAGVRVEQYGADWRYDWFTLRGFDAQTNSVFLDGLRYQFGSLIGMVEPYGLERIEILRGPSSALFGQNQPGGVVDLVQRRPTQTPQGEVRLSLGNYRNLIGAFTMSGPVDRDGVFSYSLTGLGRIAGTQVDDTRDDRVYLAPAVTWRPDADTSLTLLSYYQRDSVNGTQFLPALGTVFATPYGRIPTRRNTSEPDFDKFVRTQAGVGWAFEHRFDDTWSVRQNARYAHSDYHWQQLYGLGVGSDLRTLNRFAFRSDVAVESFQVDTQAEARFATGPLRHTLLMGADYAHSSFVQRISGAVGPSLDVYAPVYGAAIPAFTPSSNTRQVSDQVGLYAQDQIRWGDFVLTLNGRQDWAMTTIDNRLAGTRANQDDSAFTWRAGLVWLSPIGLAPYVSYARSFQPQLTTSANGQPFKPSEAEQIEVGLKYQPPGFNSFIQASLFQITQTNLPTTDPNNPLFQVQTGEVRVRGFELEGVASLAQGLNLIASFTHLNAEITKSNTAGEVGNRPSGVPQNTASLWLDYTFPEETRPFAGLGLRAGVRYVGNTPAGNANLFNVPSVTLVDAALRYDLQHLSPDLRGLQLAVNVNNLFDKDYVGRCDSATSCFYGYRRSVIGTVAYRW